MNFLVNCSNLKNGGGLQVADSIYRQLNRFPRHRFIVVFSKELTKTENDLPCFSNTDLFTYNVKNNISTLLKGRDSFLDDLVRKFNIDAVLTIFGPSRWRPYSPHLCGFARAQLLRESAPFPETFSIPDKIKYFLWAWGFRKSSDTFYSENEYISHLLPDLVGRDKKIYTVTNYYNQVFDQPEKWKRIKLPPFDGCTLLTVSSAAPHKNLPIMEQICQVMEQKHPNFHFRFVLTLDKERCPWVTKKNSSHYVFLGKVDISECPPLYEQADIMFMPTLLECFTATYPEAMRMEVPIVTTDLEFAHGLCNDAACYYGAVDAEAAAEAIYKVANDKGYAHQLTESGKKQLLKFDNYEQRAEKLIQILEEIATKEHKK